MPLLQMGKTEVQSSPVTRSRLHNLLISDNARIWGQLIYLQRTPHPLRCCNFPRADSRTNNFQNLLWLLCLPPNKGSGGNSLSQVEAPDFCGARAWNLTQARGTLIPTSKLRPEKSFWLSAHRGQKVLRRHQWALITPHSPHDWCQRWRLWWHLSLFIPGVQRTSHPFCHIQASFYWSKHDPR